MITESNWSTPRAEHAKNKQNKKIKQGTILYILLKSRNNLSVIHVFSLLHLFYITFSMVWRANKMTWSSSSIIHSQINNICMFLQHSYRYSILTAVRGMS